MKPLYRYAIIRFCPFAETEEFANIGVIAVDLSHGQIDYRIASRHFPRVAGFFGARGYAAYEGAIDLLTLELGRISEYMLNFHAGDGDRAFQAMIARRESTIRFSEPRVAQADVPLLLFIEQLYARFVRTDPDIETPGPSPAHIYPYRTPTK
ncbi:DUF3037 domain-containing protein [uncultured Sphingomonas sp.]|uniref:DUF3037 domain-containing protein n=1 Tax=uncultured Sphingomonas sp. TaxID=158754 RepID=UPI0025DF2178|nr:DUF3037 domain-containing protein [uncultured Sphingomonas sp.]